MNNNEEGRSAFAGSGLSDELDGGWMDENQISLSGDGRSGALNLGAIALLFSFHL